MRHPRTVFSLHFKRLRHYPANPKTLSSTPSTFASSGTCNGKGKEMPNE
jgi:hypothetical protein